MMLTLSIMEFIVLDRYSTYYPNSGRLTYQTWIDDRPWLVPTGFCVWLILDLMWLYRPNTVPKTIHKESVIGGLVTLGLLMWSMSSAVWIGVLVGSWMVVRLNACRLLCKFAMAFATLCVFVLMLSVLVVFGESALRHAITGDGMIFKDLSTECICSTIGVCLCMFAFFCECVDGLLYTN
jgi:hypothetical protein